MTRLRLILLLLLPLLCLLRPGRSQAEAVRLMVVSDLHYLSSTCFDADPEGLFAAAIRRGDGKMSQYSPELLEALQAEALHQHPDALIVTGDLTFNGELASHQDLSQAFHALAAQGIPVYLIPGNHDINNPNARSIPKYAILPAENTSPEAFEALYADFRGETGGEDIQFSSLVRLRENLWLALCDASVYRLEPLTEGLYTNPLQNWLLDVLSQAREAGAQVITATHQSVVPHTQLLLSSMTVSGYGQMISDLRQSGAARLNLSGHLHVQHISEQDGFYDIATGCFSLPPFRYGLLTVEEDGRILYEAQSLCPDHLSAEINQQAATWFEDIFISKEYPALAALNLPEEEIQSLLAFGARLNHAYFSGDLGLDPTVWTQDPMYRRWVELIPQLPFASYLTSIPVSPDNALDALFLQMDHERRTELTQ